MSNYLDKVKQHIDVNFNQIEKLDEVIYSLLGATNLNENTSYLRELITAKERLVNSTNSMMKEHMISTRHQRTEQTKVNKDVTRVTNYDMPRGSGKTTEIAEKMKRDTNTYCIIPIKELKDTYKSKVDVDTFKRVYAYCELSSLLSSIKNVKNITIYIDEIDRFNFYINPELGIHSRNHLISYLLDNNIQNIVSYTTALTSEK